mgnify:CR=1 FL=1
MATKLVEAEATTIKNSAIIVICMLSNLPIISVGLVNILSKSSNFWFKKVSEPTTIKTAKIENEATTSKIGEDQIFYCNQRGIDTEKAIAIIVNGFSKEVLNKLPMEFAVEAQKLLEISLEGSVG